MPRGSSHKVVSSQVQGRGALVMAESGPCTVYHTQTTTSETLLWAWQQSLIPQFVWIFHHLKKRGIHNLHKETFLQEIWTLYLITAHCGSKDHAHSSGHHIVLNSNSVLYIPHDARWVTKSEDSPRWHDNKVLLEYSWAQLICMLSVAAFMIEWHNWTPQAFGRDTGIL